MPWIEPDAITKAETALTPFEQMIRKSDRTVIPEFVWEPSYKIREPIYNFEELILITRTSWVLKKVFSAIIRETLSPGWKLDPAFAGKCPKCGREYSEPSPKGKCETKECKNATLILPDYKQKKMALALLKKPSNETKPRLTFNRLLRSCLFYYLSLDNYFLSISYKHVTIENGGSETIRVPAEIDVEDPRYFRVVSDDKGHLGDPNQLFCPTCWKPDLVYSPPQTTCPKCGKPLERTAYVQRVAGAIKARFTEDEIVHESWDRWEPNLYGESRIVCLWKLIISLQAMDDYNYELYNEGKLGSIVNFPGHRQEEVNTIMDEFEQSSLRKRVFDPILRRFRSTKKIRTMMIGSKEPVSVTKIMEDFKSMQSMEFYKFWTSAVASVYGVMPVFVGDIERGKTGTAPSMQVNVQDRAIREIHSQFEDVINNRLFPLFGITDWSFHFDPLELRDELRLAQIGQIKANTALTWLKSGFSVRVNSEGDVEIWGEGRAPKAPEGGWEPPSPENIPIESEATGMLRERTGRFAPKPAGEEEKTDPVSSDTQGIYNPRYSRRGRWVNPQKHKHRKEFGEQ